MSHLYPLQSQPFPSSAQKVNAWTDGSCSVKGCRSGGWAFHARFQGRVLEGVGSETHTTISVMELTALVKLLERLKPTSHPLQVHCDSEYVVKSMTDYIFNWLGSGFIGATGKPVKNKELMLHAHELLNRHRAVRPVALVWIRGHMGDGGNERCDELAGKARRALLETLKSAAAVTTA